MIDSLKLEQNANGTYDVIIFYNKFDTEFAKDFFTKEMVSNRYRSVAEFIAKNKAFIQFSGVKIMASDMVIAHIPADAFLSVFTDDEFMSCVQ